jgi:hypothetical protein
MFTLSAISENNTRDVFGHAVTIGRKSLVAETYRLAEMKTRVTFRPRSLGRLTRNRCATDMI